MKKKIVNLGGACYTAELLNFFELRRDSMPFDWIWNLDCGLIYLKKIIESNFEQFLNIDNYAYLRHPRWPTSDILTNKYYPK